MTSVISGSVASSTDAMPDGTYFSAQKSGPYSATNMRSPIRARLRHWALVGRGLSAEAHETVQQNARDEESGSSGEERRHFLDCDPNGQECGSPENVDGEKCEQDADVECFRYGGGRRFDNRCIRHRQLPLYIGDSNLSRLVRELAVKMPFELIAGQPALDLVNTLDWRLPERGA